MTARHQPFPPSAGFVRAVATAPYPPFPESPLKRIGWAMGVPLKHPSLKQVLTVLAYRADEKGRAWPSYASIADNTALSRRQVIRTITALEGTGWLGIYRRARRSSLYFPKRPRDQLCRGCWILLPAEAEFCPACGYELVATSCHHLVTPCHPEGLKKIHKIL